MRSNMNNPVVSSLHNKEMGNPVGRKPSHFSWQKVVLVAGAIIGYFFLSRCYSLFIGSSNSLTQVAPETSSSLQPVDTKEEPALKRSWNLFFFHFLSLVHYKNSADLFFQYGHDLRQPLRALLEISRQGGMATLRSQLNRYYQTLLPLSKKDNWDQNDANRACELVWHNMEFYDWRGMQYYHWFLPSPSSPLDKPAYEKLVSKLEGMLRAPFLFTPKDVALIIENNFKHYEPIQPAKIPFMLGEVSESKVSEKLFSEDIEELTKQVVKKLQEKGLVSSDRHYFIL